MKRVLKDYPQISLKPEYLNGKIDFSRIFGRFAPVHVEIGSGKGTFLLSQAKAQPDVNFLGIESANKYYRYAVDRIGRWGLKNVRVLRIEAAFFLAEFVPDGSVNCFHIYFPDPWPKKRHHKRRFFKTENLNQILRTLKVSGVMKVATDHAEYFQLIKRLLNDNSDTLEQIDFLPAVSAKDGESVGTNFERKYIEEKRPIYTIAVKKIKSIP